LTVLAHHYDWSGIRRLKRQGEVQQNEGVGIPPFNISGDVDSDPPGEKYALKDYESPRSHRRSHPIRDALSKRKSFVVFVLDVPRGPAPVNETLDYIVFLF